jgi:hypothetical protein
MKTLMLIGWRKGLRKVSLTKAIAMYSSQSLAEAKRSVDDLLAGNEVTLSFEKLENVALFKRVAQDLGAIVGSDRDDHRHQPETPAG